MAASLAVASFRRGWRCQADLQDLPLAPKKSFSHRKEALNVWPSMAKLPHKWPLTKFKYFISLSKYGIFV
jgi:hypothetical protein